MAPIATYAFLDLETTSLPSLELNKTRITELSLVVVKRNHILETRTGQLPRVQHKLTMCFNPGRLIHPGSTETSGLDNFLLEHETPFNLKVFNAIDSFLECQEKPLCLVAQNGLNFDFPILKNHFEKLGVKLSDDTMCADSLHGLYEILNTGPNGIVDGQSSATETQIAIKDEENITSIELSNLSMQNGITESVSENKEEFNSPVSVQSQNETTPSSKKRKHSPAKKLAQVKRKLFYGTNQKPKQSYKLKDIYTRELGVAGIEAHRAENDCIMAAELSVAKANQFVEWVDNNHCAFSEVKAMTLGVPLGQ